MLEDCAPQKRILPTEEAVHNTQGTANDKELSEYNKILNSLEKNLSRANRKDFKENGKHTPDSYAKRNKFYQH